MKIYLNKNCLAPKGAMLKLSGKGKAWNLLLNNAMIVGVSLLVKFEVEYAAVTFESFFNQFSLYFEYSIRSVARLVRAEPLQFIVVYNMKIMWKFEIH